MSESFESLDFGVLTSDLVNEVVSWGDAPGGDDDSVRFSLGGEDSVTLPRPFHVLPPQNSHVPQRAFAAWRGGPDSDQGIFYDVSEHAAEISQGSISQQTPRKQILGINLLRGDHDDPNYYVYTTEMPVIHPSQGELSVFTPPKNAPLNWPVLRVCHIVRQQLCQVIFQFHADIPDAISKRFCPVKLSLTEGAEDIDRKFPDMRFDAATRAHYATSFAALQPGQMLRSGLVAPGDDVRFTPLRLRLARDSAEKGGRYGTLAVLQPFTASQLVATNPGPSEQSQEFTVDLLDRERLANEVIGFVTRRLPMVLTPGEIRSKIGATLQQALQTL